MKDVWDLNPFRGTKYTINPIANYINNTVIGTADNIYTKLYDKIYRHKIPYDYLGGSKLNKLRYGFNIEDNKKIKKVIDKIGNYEVGPILGGKPFTMRTPMEIDITSPIGYLDEDIMNFIKSINYKNGGRISLNNKNNKIDTMRKRRSLEYRGNYEIPVDNLYVTRPDTVYREVPNLVISPSTNPNYGLFTTGIGYNMHGQLIDYNNGRPVTEQEAKQRAKDYVNRKNANKYIDFLNKLIRSKKADGGSIHIAPSKRGTFTAAATRHGMGVQEFASKVLRNKDNYSTSLVKKANFARNAAKWNY